jgi:hypothetical protein
MFDGQVRRHLYGGHGSSILCDLILTEPPCPRQMPRQENGCPRMNK